jgi:hypothetical protein
MINVNPTTYIFMELVKAWQMADGVPHRRIFKADSTRLFNAARLSKTDNYINELVLFKQDENT